MGIKSKIGLIQQKLYILTHSDAFWCNLMRFDAFWRVLTRFDAFWRVLTCLKVKKWSKIYDTLLEVAFIFKNRLGAKISGQSEHSNLKKGQNGAIDGANHGAKWCRGVPSWSERLICHYRHPSWGPSTSNWHFWKNVAIVPYMSSVQACLRGWYGGCWGWAQ